MAARAGNWSTRWRALADLTDRGSLCSRSSGHWANSRRRSLLAVRPSLARSHSADGKAESPGTDPRLPRLLIPAGMGPATRDLVFLAAAGGDFVSGEVPHRAGEPGRNHPGDRAPRAGPH